MVKKTVMENKGQSHLYTIIIIAIVAVMIIIFGFSAIRNIIGTQEKVKMYNLEKDLTDKIRSVGPGETNTISLNAPDDYDKVCFLGNNFPLYIYKIYPQIAESYYDTSNNVFFIGKHSYSFKIDKLFVPGGFLCINNVEGLRLFITGDKGYKVIKEIGNANSVAKKASTTTSGMSLYLANGAGLTTPKGTNASNSSTYIRVAKMEGDIDTDGIKEIFYDLGPDGMSFDKDIEITLPYDPSVVKNPGNLQIIYYDGHAWIPLEINRVDPTAHMVTGITRHFTAYTVNSISNCVNLNGKQEDQYSKGDINIYYTPALETNDSSNPPQTQQNERFSDVCKSADILDEYICTSSTNYRVREYICTNGCKDGACVQHTSPPTTQCSGSACNPPTTTHTTAPTTTIPTSSGSSSGGFLSDVGNAIGGAITTVWDAIVGFITPIWNAIVGIITPIWNFISGIITSILGPIIGLISSLLGSLGGILGPILNLITGISGCG